MYGNGDCIVNSEPYFEWPRGKRAPSADDASIIGVIPTVSWCRSTVYGVKPATGTPSVKITVPEDEWKDSLTNDHINLIILEQR